MNRKRIGKIIIVCGLLGAAALMGVVSGPKLQAQGIGSRGLFDPSPSVSPPGAGIAEETLPAPEGAPATSNGAPPLDAPGFLLAPRFQKNIVDLPAPPPRTTVEAGDFRDPFFLIRGYREDSAEALEPGVTIDGVRFNSYADSPESVEKFYRDSNFSLDDVFGRIRLDNRDQGCQFCHHGIEEISRNHTMECTDCHAGNSGTRSRRRAHKGMVANPSAPDQAARFCGKCHAPQVAWMEASLMNSARGLVNLTRRAWGAAPRVSDPAVPAESTEGTAGLTPPVHEPPIASAPPIEPASHSATLVQDFLDKKCLRCHLQSEAPRRAGEFRATGCAACHMVYTNDGITLTRDRAIQRLLRGSKENQSQRFETQYAANALSRMRAYPVVHQFTVAVPSVQCEHCHNNNGVGNEFEGLFGRPARPREASTGGSARDPVLYGRQHDFLVPDIHREKGMHCIDCHGAAEIKADPSDFKTQHDAVRIRCEDCHGTHQADPLGRKLAPSHAVTKELLKAAGLNPNLARKLNGDDTVLVTQAGILMPHVKWNQGKWILYSKVNGRAHSVPVLKQMETIPVAHRVGGHLQKVECHACHARWSANEWGMHVIREPVAGRSPWDGWNFFDPVLNYLNQETVDPIAQNRDRMLLWPGVKGKRRALNGEWAPGVWFTLFAQTDWSDLVLGKNARGRVTALKPRYQYFITDRMPAEDTGTLRATVPSTVSGAPGLVLTPHAPHTIRATARPCEACHGNTRAAGLGAPFLQRVPDAETFRQTWQNEGRLPASFQLKQILAEDGSALQTVLPEGARPLNAEEARRLTENSSSYQAARYLDLQERRLDTLLQRETFPYDRMHELNKRKYGAPSQQEDLYYDKQTHRFVTRLPKEAQPVDPMPEETPVAPLEPGPVPAPGMSPRLPEGVREFSYDLFEPEPGFMPPPVQE